MSHSSALPRQFALDLSQTPPASIHNFLVSGNEELKDAIEQSMASWLLMSAEDSNPLERRWLYWWGASGSGRSHLLQAISNAARGKSIRQSDLNPNQPNAWIDLEDQLSRLNNQEVIVITVDDVDQLDERLQGSLFRILNLVQACSRYFIYLAGTLAPHGLQLREDLRTRLAWGLIFQVHPLTDSEKVAALSRAAKDRGLNLSADVLPWLINHFYRDMPSLMAMIDALDAYSLETKRAITLPLVRELLQIAGNKK
jgi:DnaA family protein